MPANEFEKRMQQKMDELKLAPSEPVWNNIEHQIRKKRNRRRLLFWLPLLFLLISGFTWWSLTSGHQQKTEVTQQQDNHLKNQDVVVNRDKKNEAVEIKAQGTRDKAQGTSDKAQGTRDKAQEEQAEKEIVLQKSLNTSQVTQKYQPIKNNKQVVANTNKQSTIVKAGKPDVKEGNNEVLSKNKKEKQVNNEVTGKDNNIKNPVEIVENLIPAKPDSINSIESESKEIPIVQAPTLDNKNSNAADSPASAKKRKTGNKKWQKEIIVQAGWSSYEYGFFNNSPSADLYSSSPQAGGSPGFYPPQQISRGTSFTIGAGFKRSFGIRTAFHIGLEYHFYSTKTRVGFHVQKDTTARYGADRIAISEFYTNGNQSPYTNRFHIIEIPVSFEYRVFKKIPLSLSAGASYGHLLKTTALSFDRLSNMYYYNPRDYVRNYVNVFSSIQYSWLRKVKITIQSGPVFQYNCVELQKVNSPVIPHLFSFDLKNTIRF